MNPRNTINFFRSPVGAFAAFCLLVFVGLTVANGFKRSGNENPMQLVTEVAGADHKPQLIETVEKDMQPFNPPPSRPERSVSDAPEEQKRTELPPISLFGDTPASESKPLSKFYAPYGRLIPCQLVITVDSSMIRTPIVGLITEDIYHGGRLVIPAGTEVHGVAQIDRVRELSTRLSPALDPALSPVQAFPANPRTKRATRSTSARPRWAGSNDISPVLWLNWM
jgi:hypothetical protein